MGQIIGKRHCRPALVLGNVRQLLLVEATVGIQPSPTIYSRLFVLGVSGDLAGIMRSSGNVLGGSFGWMCNLPRVE
jgi:hypothetical protein